jgi:hypothetical protein
VSGVFYGGKMIVHEQEELMAVEKYKLLLDLWESVNRNNTNQLQMLMATNSLLVLAFFLAGRTSWIALVACIFSLIWILSLGHTVSLQRNLWAQMEALRERCAHYALFQIHSAEARLSIWDKVPSQYYLLGTPIVATIAWLVVLLVALFK